MSKHEIATIGLILHPAKPVAASVATLAEWGAGHSLRMVGLDADRERLPPSVETLTDTELARQADALVALGGDGTMLGAMRLVLQRPVPVLGVNHGNLGFLVEIMPSELPRALDQLAGGDFTIEQLACLTVETPGVPLATTAGFNDVVLARLGRTGAVSVDLTVNDQRYGYYKSDAVVISTPHGSTAYNYAAGGPVVSPSAEAIVITPVAPMAGIGRPVVLGRGDRVSLSVAKDSAPVAVDVDGTAAGQLAIGGTLSTELRADAGQVVRLEAGRHASRSRIKLSLLDLPLRGDQLLELVPEHLREEGLQRLQTERHNGM